GALEQMGQERLGRVDDAPEVDVHDALDRGSLELGEAYERLDDARAVDESVDLTVRREDGLGERLDRVELGDVDDVRGESVSSRAGEAGRLLEAFLAQVEGCDARTPREQAQDELTADAVPASG